MQKAVSGFSRAYIQYSFRTTQKLQGKFETWNVEVQVWGSHKGKRVSHALRQIRRLVYGFLPFNVCSFEKTVRKWQQVFGGASELYLDIDRCQGELSHAGCHARFHYQTVKLSALQMHVMHTSPLICTRSRASGLLQNRRRAVISHCHSNAR